MDTVKSIYFKLRNIFVYSFVHAKLREKIGFRFISYLTKTQGWFLWLAGSEGVYDLFTLPGDDDNSANFLIKYYPSTTEEIFKALPEREQELRTTYTFKEGAPLWEDRENDLVDHFIIGRLDILWEDAAIWVNLSVPRDDTSKMPKAQLSHDLYKSILRALCIFNKAAPSMVLSRTASDGSLQADDILTILLPGEGDKVAQLAEIREILGVSSQASAAVEGSWQPVYLANVESPSGEGSPLLDKSWWSLPDESADILPEELHI